MGQVGHREHRGEGDAPALALVPQVLDGVLLGEGLHQAEQRVGHLVAGGGGGEQLGVGPLGVAHELDQPLPLVLLHAHQEHQPVAPEDAPGLSVRTPCGRR
ncbi:MAG: hypothetical protein R2755_08515 [Acidimicrobiales bacterium]